MKEKPFHRPSDREAMHIAMAAILVEERWWEMEERRAAGLGIRACQGILTPQAIVDEFQSLRVGRGLTASKPKILEITDI